MSEYWVITIFREILSDSVCFKVINLKTVVGIDNMYLLCLSININAFFLESEYLVVWARILSIYEECTKHEITLIKIIIEESRWQIHLVDCMEGY